MCAARLDNFSGLGRLSNSGSQTMDRTIGLLTSEISLSCMQKLTMARTYDLAHRSTDNEARGESTVLLNTRACGATHRREY